jgi:hypothetical protein
VRASAVAFVLGLAVGTMILIGAGMPDLHRTASSHADFSYIWAGPRTLLDGADPYDAAQWSSSVARLGTQPYADPAVYSYPPYVALALLPLGALPLPIADQVWLWGGLAAAAVTMLLVLRAYAIDSAAMAFVAALVLLVSQPATFAFHDSQWSFLLVAALGLVAIALRRSGRLALALGTALLMAKPHLAAIPLGGLGWQAWRRGDRWVAVTIAIVAAGLIAISAVVGAQWWIAWLAEVPRARAAEPNITVLPRALELLSVGAPVAYAAMALAGIAAVASDPRRSTGVALWMALGLIVTPYARSYDHVLLVVPGLIACAGMDRRLSTVFAVGSALTLLLLPWLIFVVLSPALGSESGAAIVPLAFFALVASMPSRHPARSASRPG